MPVTIKEFKDSAIKALEAASPSPQLDVQVLLEAALNFNKTQQLLYINNQIPAEKLEWLNTAIEKRKTGLPIAYITQNKEFYGYSFYVNPSVLIPKPDTEILVERALEIIIEKMDARPNSLLTICDMCTGSGCIALAILKTLIDLYNIPSSKLPKFTLVDISPQALEVARKNTKLLLPDEILQERVRFIRSNLFEQVPGSFDIILTNPPYIPHSMVDKLLQDGRSEPRLALDGDVTITGEKPYTIDGDLADDGLEIIKNLIPQAKAHLSPLGTILMETGEYNALEAEQIGKSYGFKTSIHKDLEGQLRDVELNL